MPQQWRHSSHVNVWVHEVATGKTTPLTGKKEDKPTVSYFTWIPRPRDAPSPISPEVANYPPPSIAYVQANDLYVLLSPRSHPIRITNDGAESIFNAVPDWVYEEEVFESNFALWPSPTGSYLAYLRFDETEVPIYEYPVYNPNSFSAGGTTPYLQQVKMKYPKPGFANPKVSVHAVDLDILRKHGGEGTGPSWDVVQSAKRLLHNPRSSSATASSASSAGLSTSALQNIDDALAGSQDARSERLVKEVVWLTDREALIKETNRVSDRARTLLFDLSSSSTGSSGGQELTIEGKAVRWENAFEQGGWVEAVSIELSTRVPQQPAHVLDIFHLCVQYQTVRPLDPAQSTSGAYIDVIPSPAGYRHLALFPTAESSSPIFLTNGSWEVASLKYVDLKGNKIYFTAAHPFPSQRHVFSVDIPSLAASRNGATLAAWKARDPTPLTDTSKPGYFDVKFDPKGGYYVLYDTGPVLPNQKVLGLGKNKDFELNLEDNAALRDTLSNYVAATSVYYTVTIDGLKVGNDKGNDQGIVAGESIKVNVSAREIRPPDFDASGRTRYPVLIHVYGGPNSQEVDTSWGRPDWLEYLSSTLGYLVIKLDARGTGWKGFEHRFAVSGRLGQVEIDDVIKAASKIATLPYVDEKRVGIRGWSYGGYFSEFTSFFVFRWGWGDLTRPSLAIGLPNFCSFKGCGEEHRRVQPWHGGCPSGEVGIL